MTFADFALCLVATHDLPGERCITVSFHCDLVAPGEAGDLVESEGEIVKRTGSLAFVRGRVFVNERTLASYSAVVKRLRRSPS